MMARSVVVLPTPLRPSNVTVSPANTSRSTPCSAWPSPYQALRPRTASRGEALVIGGTHIGHLDALVAADGGVVAGREGLATLHHRYPVAEIGDHGQIVLDHQNRAVTRYRADEGGNRGHVLMAHARHRLV